MHQDLNFTVDRDVGGTIETIELKPDGASVEVTDDNKVKFTTKPLQLT